MTLSPKVELCLLVAGTLLEVELSDYSHTFYVTAVTYYWGLALLCLTGLLFWIRFRRRSVPAPMWLKVIGTACVAIVAGVFLLYLYGVVTYYE
jgi:drug/metabolite transporter (DMT)-like permease